MTDQAISDAIAKMDQKHRKRFQALIVLFAAVIVAIIVLFGLPVVLVLAGRPDLFIPILVGWGCGVGSWWLACWYFTRCRRRACPALHAEH